MALDSGALRTLLMAGIVGLLVPASTRAGGGASPDGGLKPELYPEIVHSSVFLHYHPDLRHRRDGFLALERGALDFAVRYFLKAARFSDKPSQAMLAEMHWRGEGVAQDRPLGYAWMDLAAERGYPNFIAFRERYWAALSEAERARVGEIGAAVYAEYGDAVAKPRLEHMLRKGRMDFTGSRVGYVPFGLDVKVPSPSGGWMSIHEDKVYEKRFWHSREYFDWQDAVFRRPARGDVDVGPIVQDAAMPPP